MKKLVIVLSITIFALIIGFYSFSKGGSSADTNKEYLHSVSSYKEFSNNKNGYYYYGRPDCLACREVNPIIEEYVKNNELNITYINTSYWKKEEKFLDYLDNYNVDQVPLIVYYEDDIEIRRLYPDIETDSLVGLDDFIQ